MTTTFDAYLEFMCADEATQSELWSKGIEALQKNPPQNLRLSEKEGRLQDMSKEQDHMSMEPNWHYDVADYNQHSQEDYEGTQATLALAFEQRTANLIALLEHRDSIEAFDALRKTIEKRLGL